MRYKVSLFILALLVMACAAVLTVSRSTAVMGQVQTGLADELNRNLNGHVSFAELAFDTFQSASVHDVVLLDAQGHKVAAAARAVVRFNLWSVVMGKVDMTAVKEIELLQPELVLIRTSDGTWNIDSLLRDRGEQQELPFSARITLMQGRVRLTAADTEYIMTDINGTADFAPKARTRFSLTASYNGAGVAAEGSTKGQESFYAAITAQHMDVAALRPLLTRQGTLALQGGRLTDMSFVLRQQQGQLTYGGAAVLKQVGFDLEGIPVRHVEGRVSFTDKNLFLYKTTGTIAGQQAAVSGRIALHTSEPVVDLTVESQELDMAVFRPALPLTGKAAGKAHVTGMISNPHAEATLTIAEGTVSGMALSNLRATLQLHDRLLTLQEASAASLGGELQASGQFDLASRRYQARVRGTGVDITAVPSVPAGLYGRGEGDIVVTGQGSERPAVSGALSLMAASWNGVAAERVNAGFYYTGDKTEFDYINVTAGAGRMTAHGTLIGDNLQLTFQGQSLPLERLSPVAQMPLSGQADVEGTVSGTLQHPKAAVMLSAKAGRILEQPFDTAEGKLFVTPDMLTLEGVSSKYGPARHLVNGSIGLTGDKPVNLAVTTKSARAETIVNFIMPGERLTGNVDNELMITGTMASLNLTGKVKLWDGSFRGQLISRIEGEYRRSGGTTTLDNIAIKSLNTDILMAGSISPAGEMDINLTARDIELKEFRLSDNYPMAGRASFTGHLSGLVSAPAFDGRLTADTIRLNNQEITRINGTIRTIGNRIHVEHFGFAQNGGVFAFTGGLELSDNSLYGTVTVDNGQLGSLLAIVNTQVKEIEGRLNGHIEIGGTLTKPDISIRGSLLAGRIKNYPLDSIDLDADFRGGILSVNTFFAKQGSGVLAARGTADFNGPIALEVSGRDLDAGLLTAWLESNIETKGKLTFSVEVNGKTMDPQIALSLQINNGQVATAGFDELYGLFSINKGSINVNQVMLVKGPYKASAYGIIPVAALGADSRTKGTIADQMSLKVKLDQANLSILPFLSKEVSWAAGETDGQIEIGGSLYQPTVTGALTVKDGAVKLKSLGQPIQKVAVDIHFAGDTINIRSFAGSMGGGSYNLTGSSSWQGLSLADYKFWLTLDRLGIDHRYFKGPLQGQLLLTPKDGKPLLSGNLLFENDTINIPLLPELGETDTDIGLDLEVVAGKKVRLYNSFLYDILVDGKVKFSGSTLQPSSSGRISAIRGTVNYLRTSFRITDAAAEFSQFGSFLPVIHLEASTRLVQTEVKLSIHGPLQTMQMKVSSDSSLSQQQIMSLLTLRSNSGSSSVGREEMISFLDAGLQSRFISEMEGSVREAFGLDEFRVVRGDISNVAGYSSQKKEYSLNREVYNVQLGKYLSDKLLVTHTKGLDTRDYVTSIQYEFNRKTSLSAYLDSDKKYWFTLTKRFAF